MQDLLWHLTSAYLKCVYGWAGVGYVITKFSRMDSLPNFLTHGAPLRARFARAGAPLKWIWLKAISQNWADWAITGRIARVQIKFTLEGEVKTRTSKGVFLVRKRIHTNNTFKSNSVRYQMHHWRERILTFQKVVWKNSEHQLYGKYIETCSQNTTEKTSQ